ncbi:hypothetical protein [Zhongshania marina]
MKIMGCGVDAHELIMAFNTEGDNMNHGGGIADSGFLQAALYD